MHPPVDLRSDTLTTPSPAMRAAMSKAEVGDDVFGEDPTVNRLEAVAAERLGKEAALLLPTGTMANLTAFLAQTRPGDTVILHENAHPYRFEAANLARFGGLLTHTLPGDQGKIASDLIAHAILRADNPHYSPTTLVSIENTTNIGGGAYYTVDEVAAIGQFCREAGLRLHCDGARLFNAAVAQEVPVDRLAAPCDTVSFCLSKGLGAPAGSLLAGDGATIAEARRVRKQLGGGMRQAGVLAAAGLYALEHHVDDLARDHAHAARFREQLEQVGVRFLLPSPTNILMIASDAPGSDVEKLDKAGVRTLPAGPDCIRAVFHRDISADATKRAIMATASVLGKDSLS